MMVSWDEAIILLAKLMMEMDEKASERAVFILWVDDRHYCCNELGNHRLISEALRKVLVEGE